MEKKKNSIIVGSFEESSFQIDLETQEQDSNQLNIGSFANLNSHVHVGVYGEDYFPFLPVILIKLSTKNLLTNLKDLIPENLFNQLDLTHKIELFVQFHCYGEVGECQHFLCTSTVLYTISTNFYFLISKHQDLYFDESLNISKELKMGIFEPNGIAETHLKDQRDKLGAGISFEKLEKRAAIIHNSSFSPENGQFKIASNDEHNFYSFFSFGSIEEQKRSILTFHVLSATQEISCFWLSNAEKSENLAQLFTNLKENKFTEKENQILEKIQKIVEFSI